MWKEAWQKLLYLFDAADVIVEVADKKIELQQQDRKFLLVANKIDIIGEAEVKNKFSSIGEMIFISAKQHLHTEVLKERMVDAVLQGSLQTESTVVTNARHYHALKEVATSLTEIKNGLDNKLSGDLLALDIRRCLQYLGEITGEITHEDQLDYIFSKFE